VSRVTVRLWGTTVGYLGYEPGQSRIASFEYTDDFARSGVQLSPLVMPCPPALHRFDTLSERTFKGVPGVIADSLPDKFGNQLIDLFMAERGIETASITTLDRLLYVGSRGIGALEYEPSEDFGAPTDRTLALDLQGLAELAAAVTSRANDTEQRVLGAATREQGLRLIRVGSSAGGARAKALVAELDGRMLDGTVDHGPEARYWLLKFDVAGNFDRDSVDPPGMTKVEYIYSQLARELELDVPETAYVVDGDAFHFMIERFDRVRAPTGLQKLHYASWCGLSHAHRDTTGAYGYEQLVQTVRELDLGQAAVTEVFRRAVFNIVGRNQDDHTKNFGFLMDRTGSWRFAPAFDLTYAFDATGRWTQVHQIRMGGKQDGFVWDEILAFGKLCNLREARVRQLTRDTVDALSRFEQRATELDVALALRRQIAGHLRLDVAPSMT
jgi:serine/threonine-protein kinase HipA